MSMRKVKASEWFRGLEVLESLAPTLSSSWRPLKPCWFAMNFTFTGSVELFTKNREMDRKHQKFDENAIPPAMKNKILITSLIYSDAYLTSAVLSSILRDIMKTI